MELFMLKTWDLFLEIHETKYSNQDRKNNSFGPR